MPIWHQYIAMIISYFVTVPGGGVTVDSKTIENFVMNTISLKKL